jgi:hypothetical protein
MSTQYRLVQSGKTASGGCSAGPRFVRAVAPRIFLYGLLTSSHNFVLLYITVVTFILGEVSCFVHVCLKVKLTGFCITFRCCFLQQEIRANSLMICRVFKVTNKRTTIIVVFCFISPIRLVPNLHKQTTSFVVFLITISSWSVLVLYSLANGEHGLPLLLIFLDVSNFVNFT